MGNVILGAVLAFLATALVQSVIVPSANARTRQRERYERDIDELWTLLENQLPRLLRPLRTADLGVRILHQALGAPDVNQDRVRELLRIDEAAKTAAEEQVEQHTDRMMSLASRLRRAEPDERSWAHLYQRAGLLDIAIFNFARAESLEGRLPDDAEWEARWEEVDQARKAVAELVKPVLLRSMERPTLWRWVHRARVWISTRPAATRRLLTRAKKKLPSAVETESSGS